MTEGLKQILREWLEWAENGAGEHDVFRRSFGLCSILRCYDYFHGTSCADELIIIFDGVPFPFGGMDEYFIEKAKETLHLNPGRLAWVRKQLGDV